MTRPELLHVRLVAYRGMWDRFAAPGSIAAAMRAHHRGVPTLMDLDTGLASADDLLAKGLLQQRTTLVFLISKDALALADRVRALEPRHGNVFVIERSSDAVVYPIRHLFTAGQAPEPVGSYVPLSPAAPRMPDLAASDLVLYESFDTLQSLDAMRRSRNRSDDDIERTLRSTAKVGATLMRVSDLVERELLLNPSKWVTP